MTSYNYVGQRRWIARQKSRALRAYLRATGRWPRCVPTRWDL